MFVFSGFCKSIAPVVVNNVDLYCWKLLNLFELASKVPSPLLITTGKLFSLAKSIRTDKTKSSQVYSIFSFTYCSEIILTLDLYCSYWFC